MTALVVAMSAAEGRRARLIRAAVGLWLAFGVVVWNVAFDVQQERAMKVYFYRVALHQSGRGPSVAIDDVMRPAAGRAARAASAWAGAVAGAGLLLVWYARRREAGGRVAAT